MAWCSSICDNCECGEVQDEKHVLFFCKCAEVCELRLRYRDPFEGIFKTLRAFAPSSSESVPFLTCHHSITDFEINAFLNQDSYRLPKFVRFSFNFRHWLILLHQPIAISQSFRL